MKLLHVASILLTLTFAGSSLAGGPPAKLALKGARIIPVVGDDIPQGTVLIDSGRIVVAGCTDYYPDAARVEVRPGVYEAIVCYAKLDSLSPDGLDGEDSYHVHLFPGRETQPGTIKRRRNG